MYLLSASQAFLLVLSMAARGWMVFGVLGAGISSTVTSV